MAGLRDIALVAVGGAAGSVLRYGVGRVFGVQQAGSANWPWHTFAANVSGAFLIGVLVVLSARFGWPAWWRPLLAVGLLGGYTTFSTLSIEVVEAALTGHPGLALAYASASLVTGVAACWLGITLARAF